MIEQFLNIMLSCFAFLLAFVAVVMIVWLIWLILDEMQKG